MHRSYTNLNALKYCLTTKAIRLKNSEKEVEATVITTLNMNNCDPQTKISLDVMSKKKCAKTKLPWPNGYRQGFGTGSHGFDPKSRRNNYW